jgi:hypothetical protein
VPLAPLCVSWAFRVRLRAAKGRKGSVWCAVTAAAFGQGKAAKHSVSGCFADKQLEAQLEIKLTVLLR